MGCARGRSLDCSNDYTTGGVSDILIADAADVDNFTQNADGILPTSNAYTAVTMVGVGVFNPITFADDSAVFDEVFKRNDNGTLSWVDTLKFDWKKLSQDSQNILRDLARCGCGLVIIVRDNNGAMWVLNDNNPDKPKVKLRLTGYKGSTNKKTDELNGYSEVTFEAKGSEPVNEFIGDFTDIPQ